MSKITKVNLNEGKHIIGYECDSCHVKSFVPDRPEFWISSEDKDYCNDCTYECQKCHTIEYEGNIGDNDFCNSCNEKLKEELEVSFEFSEGLIDVLEDFVKEPSTSYEEREIIFKAGEIFLRKLRLRRTRIMEQLKSKIKKKGD